MTTDSQRADSGRWRTYALCGLTLASDFSFAHRLPAAAGAADFGFTCSAELPPGAGDVVPDSPNLAEVHRLDDGVRLRFPGIADFDLGSDRIVAHLAAAAAPHRVELRFLGPVLACWLEQRGIPALHASAVAVGEGRATAFLSSHHGGKSSLAAALMRSGCRLLSDDLVAVEERDGLFTAHPSYPQMRMWPTQAHHFLGHYEELEIVHPEVSKRRVPLPASGLGEFCGASQPLACVYLPERRPPGSAGEIEISTLAQRDAVIELIRHSFAATAVAILGWQERRLDFFTRLVARVPVRRLLYPDGLDRLPAVSAAILRDVEERPPG